ncbi:PHP domain-containing protein [Candidatus Omnitrophota bacterium]
MKFADLHIHTNCSDGEHTPEEVIKLACQRDLSCVAITDHDTIYAIEPAIKAAQELNLEVIPGVELSVEQDQHEIHILGYFIDWQASWFQEKLKQIRQERQRRAWAIVDKLKEQGISLDAAELKDRTASEAIGRLHIAKMLKKQGQVGSIKEAFNKYLGNNSCCYVKKFKLTAAEAIDIIARLGGLSVLAHPFVMDSDELIVEFVQLGLKGIEIYYPEHDQAKIAHYLSLAERYGLLVTGGSDCHGLGKQKATIGDVKLPYKLIVAMKKELGANPDEQKQS